MSESITALILKNILTTLEAVTALNSVIIGQILPTDKPRPLAGIIPMDEPAAMAGAGVRQGTLTVGVRVVADESDEEAVFKLIEACTAVDAAMMTDRTRGGNAGDTRYANTHWLFVDPNDPQAGADVIYEIDKKTANTDQTAIP